MSKNTQKIIIVLAVIALVGVFSYYRLAKKSGVPFGERQEISSMVPQEISPTDTNDYLDQALFELDQVE